MHLYVPLRNTTHSILHHRFLSGDEGNGAKADLLNGYEGRARMNSFGGPPRRVRTISTMDDEILLLMRASSGEDRRNTM
ncbi:hypothetical protein EON65_53950, partial [archaeon]